MPEMEKPNLFDLIHSIVKKIRYIIMLYWLSSALQKIVVSCCYCFWNIMCMLMIVNIVYAHNKKVSYSGQMLWLKLKKLGRDECFVANWSSFIAINLIFLATWVLHFTFHYITCSNLLIWTRVWDISFTRPL